VWVTSRSFDETIVSIKLTKVVGKDEIWLDPVTAIGVCRCINLLDLFRIEISIS